MFTNIYMYIYSLQQCLILFLPKPNQISEIEKKWVKELCTEDGRYSRYMDTYQMQLTLEKHQGIVDMALCEVQSLQIIYNWFSGDLGRFNQLDQAVL